VHVKFPALFAPRIYLFLQALFHREPVVYEKNVSAEQSTPQAHAWVSRPHGNPRRTQGAQQAARQGAGQALSLTPARDEIRVAWQP
jgi:hypothetical protein